MTEKILPRPVIRDGNGKRIKDHTPRDFFLKLQEEIFEAIENLEIYNQMTVEYGEGYDGTKSAVKHTAEEIADIITVCISYLNAIGYDEKGRSEIFRRVNETNEKRGYFKEAD